MCGKNPHFVYVCVLVRQGTTTGDISDYRGRDRLTFWVFFCFFAVCFINGNNCVMRLIRLLELSVYLYLYRCQLYTLSAFGCQQCRAQFPEKTFISFQEYNMAPGHHSRIPKIFFYFIFLFPFIFSPFFFISPAPLCRCAIFSLFALSLLVFSEPSIRRFTFLIFM